jgi:hypothetical protein
MQLAGQREHLAQDNVVSTCGRWFERANILSDEDMQDVHVKKVAN